MSTSPILANDAGLASSDITAEEIVERARQISLQLVGRQAETEERGFYAPDTHEAFKEAGFYRILVPRQFGGLQLGIETFFKVVVEIARGCPSSGWQFCLGSAHAPTICAIYDLETQAKLFGDGHFICAATVKPQGTGVRQSDGSWLISGTYNYCSGIPYSTHFMSHAMPVDGDGSQGAMMTFVAPRSEWTMLDDWKGTLGLRGSGSHSVQIDNGRLPGAFVAEKTDILAHGLDGVAGQAPIRGDNHEAYGRTLGLYNIEPAAIAVGMLKGALDEYALMMTSKTTARPPVVPRYQDPDYRRWYGSAAGKLAMLEASVVALSQRWARAATANALGEASFSVQEELELSMTSMNIIRIAWDTMQDILWPTAGSSAARDGQRMQRIYRDMSMARTHQYNTTVDGVARHLSDSSFEGGDAASLDVWSTRH